MRESVLASIRRLFRTHRGFILAFAVLVSGIAVAGTAGSVLVGKSAQENAAGHTPKLDAGELLPLANASAVRLTAVAAPGCNFVADAGSQLQALVSDVASGQASRSPALDKTISLSGPSQSYDLGTLPPVGYLGYQASNLIQAPDAGAPDAGCNSATLYLEAQQTANASFSTF